ncbi:MAG: phenylalanine--tRNA ligase subunit beta [Desulfobacterales bacterium]|nr:phenylalanine--tRNA ligase subunit beta [Desulfobacterales bacterium]
MKVSLSWLKEYVPVEMEVSKIADALTMRGLEIEGITNRYEYLDNVVVGEIIDIYPHPNAQNLSMADVSVGAVKISVVCGASNIKKGMLIPTAFPGTVFPDGTILKQNVIRGQTSYGMLCSALELGLGDDESGVMALNPSLKVGQKLTEALNLDDKVIDVAITPNRPDCLNIIGIAREVAAIQKKQITIPHVTGFSLKGQISKLTSVKIEAPDYCPRYCATLLENIKVKPSPFWLKERLISIGLRPINNIVDVTNFVMMEMGQPLHAFDFDRLSGNRIVVRTAKEGERFVTLDQKERILSDETLLICDGEKGVAIAGVMGGENSEIIQTTARVLIESAYFDPANIRKTSKKLGLSTEASYRFERGINPAGTPIAIIRATQLMAEISGAKIIEGLIDEYPKVIHKKSIMLNTPDVSKLLGINLNKDEITSHLKSIGFSVENIENEKIKVEVPPFRVDVSRPVDLIEEVARLNGYDKIPITFPNIPADVRKGSQDISLRSKIRELMNGFGFTEIITYSFISELSCDRLRLPYDDIRRNVIRVLNPIAEDQTVMRTSLVPGLLSSMQFNISQQIKNLKLFEVGKIFINKSKDDLAIEKQMLSCLLTGSRYDQSWHSKPIDCDFYDLKGTLEALLQALSIKNIKLFILPKESCDYYKSGYSANIFAGDNLIGKIGEIHPRVLKNYNLKQSAFIFEIEISNLSSYIEHSKNLKNVPKFPSTSRDMTLIVDKKIEGGKILESIHLLGEKLVEEATLFDVYEGSPIPPEKKSVSIKITYRSQEETLEDNLINTLHNEVTNKILTLFNAGLPVKT